MNMDLLCLVIGFLYIQGASTLAKKDPTSNQDTLLYNEEPIKHVGIDIVAAKVGNNEVPGSSSVSEKKATHGSGATQNEAPHTSSVQSKQRITNNRPADVKLSEFFGDMTKQKESLLDKMISFNMGGSDFIGDIEKVPIEKKKEKAKEETQLFESSDLLKETNALGKELIENVLGTENAFSGIQDAIGFIESLPPNFEQNLLDPGNTLSKEPPHGRFKDYLPENNMEEVLLSNKKVQTFPAQSNGYVSDMSNAQGSRIGAQDKNAFMGSSNPTNTHSQTESSPAQEVAVVSNEKPVNSFGFAISHPDNVLNPTENMTPVLHSTIQNTETGMMPNAPIDTKVDIQKPIPQTAVGNKVQVQRGSESGYTSEQTKENANKFPLVFDGSMKTKTNSVFSVKAPKELKIQPPPMNHLKESSQTQFDQTSIKIHFGPTPSVNNVVADHTLSSSSGVKIGEASLAKQGETNFLKGEVVQNDLTHNMEGAKGSMGTIQDTGKIYENIPKVLKSDSSVNQELTAVETSVNFVADKTPTMKDKVSFSYKEQLEKVSGLNDVNKRTSTQPSNANHIDISSLKSGSDMGSSVTTHGEMYGPSAMSEKGSSGKSLSGSSHSSTQDVNSLSQPSSAFQSTVSKVSEKKHENSEGDANFLTGTATLIDGHGNSLSGNYASSISHGIPEENVAQGGSALLIVEGSQNHLSNTNPSSASVSESSLSGTNTNIYPDTNHKNHFVISEPDTSVSNINVNKEEVNPIDATGSLTKGFLENSIKPQINSNNGQKLNMVEELSKKAKSFSYADVVSGTSSPAAFSASVVSNNEMDASNNEMVARNNHMYTTKNQIGTSNNQIDTGNIQMDTGTNQIGTSNNQMGVSYNQIGTGNYQMDPNSNNMGTNNIQMDAGNNQLNTDNNQIDSINNQIDTTKHQIGAGFNQMDTTYNRIDTSTNQKNAMNNKLFAYSNQMDFINTPMVASNNQMDINNQVVASNHQMGIINNQMSVINNQIVDSSNQMGNGYSTYHTIDEEAVNKYNKNEGSSGGSTVSAANDAVSTGSRVSEVGSPSFPSHHIEESSSHFEGKPAYDGIAKEITYSGANSQFVPYISSSIGTERSIGSGTAYKSSQNIDNQSPGIENSVSINVIDGAADNVMQNQHNSVSGKVSQRPNSNLQTENSVTIDHSSFTTIDQTKVNEAAVSRSSASVNPETGYDKFSTSLSRNQKPVVEGSAIIGSVSGTIKAPEPNFADTGFPTTKTVSFDQHSHTAGANKENSLSGISALIQPDTPSNLQGKHESMTVNKEAKHSNIPESINTVNILKGAKMDSGPVYSIGNQMKNPQVNPTIQTGEYATPKSVSKSPKETQNTVQPTFSYKHALKSNLEASPPNLNTNKNGYKIISGNNKISNDVSKATSGSENNLVSKEGMTASQKDVAKGVFNNQNSNTNTVSHVSEGSSSQIVPSLENVASQSTSKDTTSQGIKSTGGLRSVQTSQDVQSGNTSPASGTSEPLNKSVITSKGKSTKSKSTQSTKAMKDSKSLKASQTQSAGKQKTKAAPKKVVHNIIKLPKSTKGKALLVSILKGLKRRGLKIKDVASLQKIVRAIKALTAKSTPKRKVYIRYVNDDDGGTSDDVDDQPQSNSVG